MTADRTYPPQTPPLPNQPELWSSIHKARQLVEEHRLVAAADNSLAQSNVFYQDVLEECGLMMALTESVCTKPNHSDSENPWVYSHTWMLIHHGTGQNMNLKWVESGDSADADPPDRLAWRAIILWLLECRWMLASHPSPQPAEPEPQPALEPQPAEPAPQNLDSTKPSTKPSKPAAAEPTPLETAKNLRSQLAEQQKTALRIWIEEQGMSAFSKNWDDAQTQKVIAQIKQML